MKNPNGGTVAYIGNSGYGIYKSGFASHGPSDKYDLAFFEKLFQDNVNPIGQTLAESKASYAYLSGGGSTDGRDYYSLQMSLNLLGDPEMPIWTATPSEFEVSTTPSLILRGWSTVTVAVQSAGQPVKGA